MKSFWFKFLSLLCVVSFVGVLVMPDAEARRLGGGRSFGKSFGSVSKPVTPRNAGSSTDAAKGAAAGSRRGGLMGPIAGLAAGLGIAALASALGFGEELANLITIMLLAGVGIFAIRWLMTRLAGAAPTPQTAGATNRPGMALRDAGPARPLSGDAGTAPPAGGADVPAGFDQAAFLREAKVQFVRLQAVYDAADLADLRQFTTPEMFAELKLEIDERGASSNRTDVVTLEAELLGVRSTSDEHLAGVRFWGRVRESENGVAEPFDEVWTLSKPVSGGGWVLAGIQQHG
ncbi:MAG: TIM44-like domain-containing protein [Burkholderiaceae bacterium]